MTTLSLHNAATPISLWKKTVFLPYATEKKHPMKPQEWELHCNPTPTTENSFHWTELPPKAEERQNIKASRRKMSSSTTARFASSTSILTVKEKRRKLTFKRTFHDLHYFTRIYLGEDYFIKTKQITIHHSAIPLPFPVDRKEFYSFYSL